MCVWVLLNSHTVVSKSTSSAIVRSASKAGKGVCTC